MIGPAIRGIVQRPVAVGLELLCSTRHALVTCRTLTHSLDVHPTLPHRSN
jgi:hypothetical protein